MTRHRTKAQASPAQAGHLLLSRSPGESIVIDCPCGQRIEIEVHEVRKSGRTRLGVRANGAVSIWRKEIDPKAEQPQR